MRKSDYGKALHNDSDGRARGPARIQTTMGRYTIKDLTHTKAQAGILSQIKKAAHIKKLSVDQLTLRKQNPFQFKSSDISWEAER